MSMKEIGEKKAANYITSVQQMNRDTKMKASIKQDFHLRALIKSVAK